ncbi:phosphotransferase family protein [Halobacillus sp. Marseille-Q1614]|uniref:phosphotransferase family protein n=1 Tax=Halobacillus sp. Marseille-Q1614 TaxID=2709134 RepID=UPI00156EC639|nr:phosphotransferase [Halobacillus sp. Marseille-Q1614]
MRRDKLSSCIEAIESSFPDYKISNAEPIGEGWMSIALKVNDEWVFRFAKNEKGSADLEKEIKILPKLKEAVTVAIPEFEYVGKQTNGQLFVGYKLLPGTLLEEEAVPHLNQDQKKKLGSQLARFIKELHAFSIEEALKAGVPQFNLKSFFSKLYEETKRDIFPRIEPSLSRYISSRFGTYLSDSSYFSYTPALIHGDLSPDHFLTDPKTDDLSGIIDFGDLCISDPDYEFIYILEDCGENFTRELLKEMEEKEIDRCIQKVSHFVTFDHIRYVLEGIKRGESEWIEEGLDEIRKEMREEA